MLQEFLNQNLLEITEDNNFEKLKKASDDVAKKLSKNKSKVLSYTLIALDPEVPVENPDILEVKDLITKYWSTFTANSKDTPITYVRAVMLEALQTVSSEISIACLIWLSGRNVIKYYKLIGKEKELLSTFLLELGNKVELEASEAWALLSQIKIQKLNIEIKELTGGEIDMAELEKHLKVASIHTALGDGGGNPQYPSHNSLAWPQYFAQRSSQGISDVVNQAFKQQSKGLSESQTRIQEAVNELLNQTQSEIIKRNSLLQKRTELLWWKEACYSSSIKQSYRDQKDGLLQILLATDYSFFVPTIYPASADYFLKETHKCLVSDGSKKIKVSEILKSIEASSSQLKTIFDEYSGGDGRISFINFIKGLLWNKYNPKQFKDLVGFPDSSEISWSDFTVWLFHDLQSHKILNNK